MRDQFIDAIKNGLTSNNQIVIEQASDFVEKFLDESPLDFFKECFLILEDQNTSYQHQRVVTTTLINSLPKVSSNNDPYWNFLGDVDKDQMLTIFLALLGKEDISLKKDGAQLISLSLVHEFRKGRWQDVIPNMTENSHSDVLSYQMSAILTLGYICEDLVKADIKLDQNLSKDVMIALLGGLGEKKPISMKEVALTALLHSLTYMEPHLKDRQNLDTYMGEVVKSIICDNENVQVIGFRLIADVIKICYDDFGHYMEKITQISQTLLEKGQETSIIAVTEFWGQLANIEHETAKKKRDGLRSEYSEQTFFKHNGLNITQALMKNLTFCENFEDDPEMNGNSIQAASYRSLIEINLVLQEDFLDLGMAFIDECMRGTDPSKNIAALAVFSSMSYGLPQVRFASIFNSSLETLMSLFKNMGTSIEVRIMVLRFLTTASETQPRVLLQHSCLDNHLLEVLTFLEEQSPIAKYVAILFQQLLFHTSEINIQEIEGSLLGIRSKEILNEVLLRSFNDNKFGNMPFMIEAFNLVVTMNLYMINKCDIQSFVEMYIEALKSTLKQEKQLRDTLQEGFLVCLQVTFWRMNKEQLVMYDQTGSKYFQDLVNIFQSSQDVSPEGVLALATLGVNMKQNFYSLRKEALKYLKASVEIRDNYDSRVNFFSSISLMVRDIKVFESDVMRDDVIRPLLVMLNDDQTPHEKRISLITYLADCLFCYYDVYFVFSQDILTLFSKVFDGCEHFLTKKGIYRDHGEELKNAAVGSLQSIMVSLGTAPFIENFCYEDIGRFLPRLLSFIGFSISEELNPQVDYCVICMNLLVDICTLGNQQFGRLAQENVLLRLEELLQRVNDAGEDVQNALTYYRRIKSQTSSIQ